ncbi:MAG: hypothetical protein Q9180_002122 [Flavoplaca navasiana]
MTSWKARKEAFKSNNQSLIENTPKQRKNSKARKLERRAIRRLEDAASSNVNAGSALNHLTNADAASSKVNPVPSNVATGSALNHLTNVDAASSKASPVPSNVATGSALNHLTNVDAASSNVNAASHPMSSLLNTSQDQSVSPYAHEFPSTTYSQVQSIPYVPPKDARLSKPTYTQDQRATTDVASTNDLPPIDPCLSEPTYTQDQQAAANIASTNDRSSLDWRTNEVASGSSRGHLRKILPASSSSPFEVPELPGVPDGKEGLLAYQKPLITFMKWIYKDQDPLVQLEFRGVDYNLAADFRNGTVVEHLRSKHGKGIRCPMTKCEGLTLVPHNWATHLKTKHKNLTLVEKLAIEPSAKSKYKNPRGLAIEDRVLINLEKVPKQLPPSDFTRTRVVGFCRHSRRTTRASSDDSHLWNWDDSLWEMGTKLYLAVSQYLAARPIPLAFYNRELVVEENLPARKLPTIPVNQDAGRLLPQPPSTIRLWWELFSAIRNPTENWEIVILGLDGFGVDSDKFAEVARRLANVQVTLVFLHHQSIANPPLPSMQPMPNSCYMYSSYDLQVLGSNITGTRNDPEYQELIDLWRTCFNLRERISDAQTEFAPYSMHGRNAAPLGWVPPPDDAPDEI